LKVDGRPNRQSDQSCPLLHPYGCSPGLVENVFFLLGIETLIFFFMIDAGSSLTSPSSAVFFGSPPPRSFAPPLSSADVPSPWLAPQAILLPLSSRARPGLFFAFFIPGRARGRSFFGLFARAFFVLFQCPVSSFEGDAFELSLENLYSTQCGNSETIQFWFRNEFSFAIVPRLLSPLKDRGEPLFHVSLCDVSFINSRGFFFGGVLPEKVSGALKLVFFSLPKSSFESVPSLGVGPDSIQQR